jgi:hypothetical protein
MEGYDIAQICPNGHVANSSVRLFPQFNQSHCDKCGEKTSTECPKCKTPIRGGYHAPGVLLISEYTAPAFCQHCGCAFPWTERTIQSAIELAVESGGLSQPDQEQFTQSVHEIAHDTPKAKLAGSRLARLLGKMTKTTADAVRDMLVDIASEAVKKVIWPEK